MLNLVSSVEGYLVVMWRDILGNVEGYLEVNVEGYLEVNAEGYLG